MSTAIPKPAQQMTSGPTAPVPKDPQPSVDRIDELARRILNGDILLPKFQRSFVWEKPQILKLLDSVARGYPIGGVLLWQSTQELRSEKTIAELEIELPRAGYPVNYLLDGQQRLSAICGALFWRGSNPTSRWNLVYNLRDKEFSHLDTLDDPPLHLVRLNKLADATEYFKHVASLDTLSAPDKAALKVAAEALFQRFKDYKIATVTLGDMSIEDVAPIFERINSSGTPLTIVDLMRAATWSMDFDLIDSIEAILNELYEKGFEEIDKKVVLRNLSAATGGGFSAGSIDQLRNRSVDALKQAVTDTTEAYKRMVDFLANTLKLPNSAIVPYANQLTVLAEVFRSIKRPTASQFDEMQVWFWRTSLSGYFGGWNTGMMGADHRAVQAFANGSSVELYVNVIAPPPAIWIQRQFRMNNAHAKLLGIVLAYHSPIDILTGQPVDVGHALSWTNAKEYHHFFPDAYLKQRGVSGERINSLANLIMLSSASNKTITNRAPSDYLRDVQAAAGGQLEKWLASNLISTEAYQAALIDDYDTFLKERARTIHDAVTSLAKW